MQLRIRTYHPNNEVKKELEIPLTSCVLSPKEQGESQTLLFFDTEALCNRAERDLLAFLKYEEELFMRIDDVYVKSPHARDVTLVGGPGQRFAEVQDADVDMLFVIPGDINDAWASLSARFSCPTRESWGPVILPQAIKTGLLIECETRDPQDSTDFKSAYIVNHDERVFDQLVMYYVKEHGIGDRPCPNMTGT